MQAVCLWILSLTLTGTPFYKISRPIGKGPRAYPPTPAAPNLTLTAEARPRVKNCSIQHTGFLILGTIIARVPFASKPC